MNQQTAGRGWRPNIGRLAFLGCLAICLLLPMAVSMVGKSTPQSDNRALAPAPGFPQSLPDLVAWPHATAAYLDDHFGLRGQLVRADIAIRWHLLSSSKVTSIVPGRNDRIFLSDGEVPYRVLLADCGAWWSDSYYALFAHDAEIALRRLRVDLPDISVLVIPTSPVLYPRDLPAWITRACIGHPPLVTKISQMLPNDLQSIVYYPIADAAHLPASTPLIPKNNFHWDGYGVDLFLQSVMEERYHLKRIVQPTWTERSMAADLSTFLPGLGLSNMIGAPNWEATDARFCYAQQCLSQSPLDGLTTPLETLRATRPGNGGGRLLLLSDSFGTKAASSLIEYFNDVIVINMNTFQTLSPDQRQILWRRLTTDWHPDHALVLFEDGNITLPARFATSLPPT